MNLTQTAGTTAGLDPWVGYLRAHRLVPSGPLPIQRPHPG